MKRFTMFLLPFAAIVLGLAAAASADDLPNYYLTLVYNTSYDASGHDVGRLSSTVVDTGNNTTKRTIQLSGTAVVHSFEVYYTAQNMAPDQDTACFEYYPVVTGGAALGDSDRGIGDFFTPSTLATTPVDPPEMGLPGNTSNLGSSLPFALNYWNGIGIDQIVNFGSIGVMAPGTPGNGTLGDMAACIGAQKASPTVAESCGIGEGTAGPWGNGAYDFGSVLISTDAVTSTAGFSFSFPTGTGWFGVINHNGGAYGLGMASSVLDEPGGDMTWPDSTPHGDSIEFTPALPRLPGDANGDGTVDGADLNIVLSNYGLTSGATWATGDFNGDGAVDGSDLNVVLSNYGASSHDTAAVPEPDALGLLVLGVLGPLGYAWRKK